MDQGQAMLGSTIEAPMSKCSACLQVPCIEGVQCAMCRCGGLVTRSGTKLLCICTIPEQGQSQSSTKVILPVVTHGDIVLTAGHTGDDEVSEGDEEDMWPDMMAQHAHDGNLRVLIDACTPTKRATATFPLVVVTEKQAHKQQEQSCHPKRRRLRSTDEVQQSKYQVNDKVWHIWEGEPHSACVGVVEQSTHGGAKYTINYTDEPWQKYKLRHVAEEDLQPNM